MTRSNRRQFLSTQILGYLLVVPVLVIVSLVLIGYNAISMADATARVKQERFAMRNLAEEVARLPEQQRSGTVWDEAILRTEMRDHEWMDANLGSWMQEYFGHDESYILDPSGRPLFAAIEGETISPQAYTNRAEVIAPLVMRLRTAMAEIREGSNNFHEQFAEVSVVAPLRFDTGIAVVSVVPIISDTGQVMQTSGREALHVAVRHVDAAFAAQIGNSIELRDVAFQTVSPIGGLGGVPVTDPSGDVITWLVWQPDRPGTDILKNMLPVLLASAVAITLLLWCVTRRLLRVSGQLEVSEAHARFLANHDALTGLPNRALFHDRLIEALYTAGRSGRSVALLAIDLDRFKLINDSLGHPAGDELIRQVGGRLTKIVRTKDTVARFGGDEFMILLDGGADDGDVRRICAKIVTELSRPYVLLGNSGCIGASVGAVRAESGHGCPNDLLQRADMALYRAKAQGKGRYDLFREDLTDTVRHRREIGDDLRAALGSGAGLHLVYQPFFDREGQVTGAEALCRWDHPSLGALSPEVFIPVAEERGLIDQLGQWVLDEASRFAAEANLAKIAVNVSLLQLRNPDFVSIVLRTLESSGLEPERLELELTEKAVLEQSREIADTLIRLRDTGIKIALDDFATGNSSLQYLRDHRVDGLKIDRTFVARLGKDEESDRLIQAIFGLARAIGISVTVEGVETEMQRNLLASMGCKTFQGFLLSRPMEPRQFQKLLKDREIQHSAGSI